jgi:dienelactone hydrolase
MKRIAVLVLTSLFSWAVQAEVQTQEIQYTVGENEFTGYLAYDEAVSGKRPGVLVAHEWWGHNAYARKRAEMLAELGYTALALDMYGTGKVANHPDDAKKFMQAVTGDFREAEKRFLAAHKILSDHATVDRDKTAAIGYCMGGGISLHMARAGTDLDGVVSFHGSLGTETPATPGRIKAKILVLTGDADPFVPAEQVQAFKEEMKKAGVPYELKSYPGIKHSFTNPAADSLGEKFDMPLAYDEAADQDSWQRMQAFFEEIFQD